MAGKVLNMRDIITPDQMAVNISQNWITWNTLRQNWLTKTEEIRKYVYATDTTQTTNAKLPWKNKTTIPKICQIRDNLFANYYASTFPSSKRSSYEWEAYTSDGNALETRNGITNYVRYITNIDRFKKEMAKCILDYIDYGNCFATVEWVDERQILPDKTTKVGYVGPVPRRISPLDIVFNPTAPSFYATPKIVRTLMSIGEVKMMLESMSNDENRDELQDLFNYLRKTRTTILNDASDLKNVDTYFTMDGFTSFRAYMASEFVEVLTFYGDIYDWQNDKFYKNHQIMVVDRHRILGKPKPNPSYFGFPPIFHVGWRPRQDNLWGMGPLENLVGMQYRLDHVENLKADVWDLVTHPPLKITGYVEDFEYGPMERIYVGDNGNVEMLVPAFQILEANNEIAYLTNMMEEMAGAPKEAMGFRTPGEKTAYEVQRLENAASRIFMNRIVQFEELFEEPLLNAELEMSRRHIDAAQTIPVWDDEFSIQTFVTLSPEELTGFGKVRPIAARHFAQKAEIVQNLTNFANSKLGSDPAIQVHFSSIATAKMFEDLLEIKEYKIVTPYIRLSEQADAARLQNAHMEQVGVEQQTPAGLTPDDHDPELGGNIQPSMGQVAQAIGPQK